jgi:L-ascorbate metabolism protein UlaG (beta-lactamase superfamily)
MQIRYNGKESFNIKLAQANLKLGDQIQIDDFLLPGPGEYEKAGISITGIPDGDNTIYSIRAEEINLCYLGKIARELPENEIKEIGNVDILFLPLGQDGTLSLKNALSLLSKIDPRIVIPMLYDDLTEFKKSEGITDEEIDLLKIRRSELPEEERKIVILKPTGK